MQQAPRNNVVVRNLAKSYGSLQALAAVSFEIGPGEVFGLLGPNGAGKTTAVETLLGLIHPDAGSIEICGIDATHHPGKVRQKIGVALQFTGLQDKITPREALRSFGALYNTPADPGQLLDRFGLAGKADTTVDTLSGGQRQRLALALAVVNRPAVIILDEPSTGLDPQMRRHLHDEIRTMKHDGLSVLLTTHDMDEAEQLCDRIAILNHGRIVAQGTPQQLIAASRASMRIAVQTGTPLHPEWLATIPALRDLACKGNDIQAIVSNPVPALAALLQLLHQHSVDLIALRVGTATLEDVILERTNPKPA